MYICLTLTVVVLILGILLGYSIGFSHRLNDAQWDFLNQLPVWYTAWIYLKCLGYDALHFILRFFQRRTD